MFRSTISINDVELSSLLDDDEIDVIDVQDDGPKVSIDTSDTMRYSGLLVTSRRLQTRKITVTLAVYLRSRTDREAKIRQINVWAQQGFLKYSDRPNQKIYVYCTGFLEYSSMNWSDKIKLEFTAYFPYWESTAENTVSLVTTTGGIMETAYINNLGNVVSPLEFRINNNSSSAMSTCTVKVENSLGADGFDFSFSFSGLDLAANYGRLECAYDVNRLLTLKKYNLLVETDVMDKRTIASDDDLLMATSGSTLVRVTTGVPCSILLTSRGLLL